MSLFLRGIKIRKTSDETWVVLKTALITEHYLINILLRKITIKHGGHHFKAHKLGSPLWDMLLQNGMIWIWIRPFCFIFISVYPCLSSSSGSRKSFTCQHNITRRISDTYFTPKRFTNYNSFSSSHAQAVKSRKKKGGYCSSICLSWVCRSLFDEM